MKKAGLLIIVVLFLSMISMAQNRQNATPEEMAKSQTEQINKKCDLDKTQEKKVYEVSLKSGKEMAKLRDEMRNGNGDRDAMREKMGKIRDTQNKEMKKILSDEQYEKYEKYLEERRAEMRQRRGGGSR